RNTLVSYSPKLSTAELTLLKFLLTTSDVSETEVIKSGEPWVTNETRSRSYAKFSPSSFPEFKTSRN
ncbi:hypothetical protein, partial [Leptospira borgpetersenii]|uniref:hypothetical protein n=1 Tax=Leptospira borgpetersenii TaxID=174 RepID=UPI0027DE08D7